MRSSISDSDAAPRFYSKVLVVICTLLVVMLEAWAQMMTRYSTTDRRISRQYAEALKLRPAAPGEPLSVLMVGNSLLLDGVDIDQLHRLTSTTLKVSPVFLEGTAYYDWYYGLRRLFRHGARPQVVIVGLGLDDVLQDAVRQEYAPRMLFDQADILHASADLGLDRTMTASLLLGHWSAFWDMRHVFRVQIMRHSIPFFEDLYLTNLFSHLKAKQVMPVNAESEAVAARRLDRLRQLGESYGARVVILIPPTPSSPMAVQRMTVVARQVGLETLMPVDPTTLPASFYQTDEIHLNQTGAALFTSALGVELPARIRVRDNAHVGVSQ
jgi:hypothetical protein